jgi:hypothetical protein
MATKFFDWGFTTLRRSHAGAMFRVTAWWKQKDIAAERPDNFEQQKSAFDRWNSEMIDPLWPPIGVKASPAFSVDGVAIDWPV